MTVEAYMKKLGIALSFLCLFSSVSAQYSELGFTLGSTYYIGDLNPYKHYPKGTGIAGGAVFRYNFDKRYAMKINLIYGSVEAHDADSDSEVQQQRNLHFRSSLLEFGLNFEVNFFEYEIGDKQHRITPYLFLGIAYYRFNPRAELDDTWFELQPLGTEGQGSSIGTGEEYGLNQVNIPFGAGIKFSPGKHIGVGLEWGYRRTFTDYLDDVSTVYVDNDALALENGVLSAELADRSLSPDGTPLDNTDSQRGNSSTRDWYVYSGIIVTYKLGSRFQDCKNPTNRR